MLRLLLLLGLLLLLLLPLLLLLLLLLFLPGFVVASFGVKSKLTPSFFSNPPPPKRTLFLDPPHPPHSHSPAPLTHPPTPLTQCLLPPAKGTPF